MEQLKNFLPVIIFVAVYVAADIYTATAALMIAVALQVAVYLLLKKPLSMELKLTFWVGLIAGSLTLFFRNELFIQWKTTVINWLMAGGLIGTHFFGKSYGTEVVLKAILANAAQQQTDSVPTTDSVSAVLNEDATEHRADGLAPAESSGATKTTLAPELDDASPASSDADNRGIWRNVNLLWIGSFTLAGALNLIVAYNASLDFWVTYKLVGGMTLSLLTIIITIAYLYKTGLIDDLVPDDAEEQQQTP